jgi:tetratricopeptide (TPR) repeat protein
LHERLDETKEAEAIYTKLTAAAIERKLPELANQAQAQLAASQIRRRRFVDAARYYEEAVKAPTASVATWQTWSSLMILNRRWPDAIEALDTLAARQAKTPGTAPSDLLNTRLRSVLCRFAIPKATTQPPPPGFDALKAALQPALVSPSGRTAATAEAAAFVAWIEEKSAPPARLAYVSTDERWAAFNWRRVREDGELEIRGRVSPTAQSWRSLLEELRKQQPTSWAVSYAHARVLAGLGFTEEALALLESVSKAKPDWWAPHFARGQYYARERDQSRGVPVLRETLRLAPECRQARTYLSLLTNLKAQPPRVEEIELDGDM